MKEVDTVLLISSGDQGDRMQEHKNVIEQQKNVALKMLLTQAVPCKTELHCQIN
jgi:hypothetical protein